MSSNICLETQSFFARVMDKDGTTFVGGWAKPDSALIKDGKVLPFASDAPATVDQEAGAIIYIGPMDIGVQYCVVEAPSGALTFKTRCSESGHSWDITEAGTSLPFDGSDNFPPR